MPTIQVTEQEIALAMLSLAQFAEFATIDAAADLSKFPPIRRLQIEHCRWQASKLDARADCSLPVLNLGLVEEACWELPIAIEADSREDMFDALGDILIFTCGICTDLRLDFLTLTRNFEPDVLQAVEGLDGIMNLFKAIGMLAHVVVHQRQYRRGYSADETDLDGVYKTRKHAAAAIARVCSAVHWLAFSNDWDASVLFQEVLTQMMAKRDWSQHSLSGEATK